MFSSGLSLGDQFELSLNELLADSLETSSRTHSNMPKSKAGEATPKRNVRASPRLINASIKKRKNTTESTKKTDTIEESSEESQSDQDSPSSKRSRTDTDKIIPPTAPGSSSQAIQPLHSTMTPGSDPGLSNVFTGLSASLRITDDTTYVIPPEYLNKTNYTLPPEYKSVTADSINSTFRLPPGLAALWWDDAWDHVSSIDPEIPRDIYKSCIPPDASNAEIIEKVERAMKNYQLAIYKHIIDGKVFVDVATYWNDRTQLLARESKTVLKELTDTLQSTVSTLSSTLMKSHELFSATVLRFKETDAAFLNTVNSNKNHYDTLLSDFQTAVRKFINDSGASKYKEMANIPAQGSQVPPDPSATASHEVALASAPVQSQPSTSAQSSQATNPLNTMLPPKRIFKPLVKK